MKGLLIKDLCNMRQITKQFLLVLAIVTAWSLFLRNSQFTSMMASFYCMMLMLTAISYDEASHFDKYALTLPVTRRDMVKAKYALLLILFAIGLLIGVVSNVILTAFLQSGGTDFLEQMVSMLTVSCVYLLAFCVFLPVIFRLGTEKARIILVMIFFAAFGLMYGGMMLLKALGVEVSDSSVFAALGVGAVLVVAGFFLSYWISVRIMQKKEW